MKSTQTIDLGCANGWSMKARQLFNDLEKIKIEGSQRSRNISNCYNEYSFDVIEDNVIATVIYTIDSGD